MRLLTYHEIDIGFLINTSMLILLELKNSVIVQYADLIIMILLTNISALVANLTDQPRSYSSHRYSGKNVLLSQYSDEDNVLFWVVSKNSCTIIYQS